MGIPCSGHRGAEGQVWRGRSPGGGSEVQGCVASARSESQRGLCGGLVSPELSLEPHV